MYDADSRGSLKSRGVEFLCERIFVSRNKPIRLTGCDYGAGLAALVTGARVRHDVDWEAKLG